MTPQTRLSALDASRFVAAVAVVLFHWGGSGMKGGKVHGIEPFAFDVVTQFGNLGVNFFFLISGFVIVYSMYGEDARQVP